MGLELQYKLQVMKKSASKVITSLDLLELEKLVTSLKIT